MEESEYDDQKKALIKSHERDLFELAKKFAISKATAKVGDMVSDGRITIKIERGRVLTYSPYPSIIWIGAEYTKKMLPRKDGSIGYIEDSRIDRFV